MKAKQFMVPVALTIIALLLFSNLFVSTLLADTAVCGSGECTCSCEGDGCDCAAARGSCLCGCGGENGTDDYCAALASE